MTTRREKWLKDKNNGIGGGDASAVLGKNPYKTNVEAWEEKTGRRQPEDISGKDYVQYGLKAERPLIELFALDHPQYQVVIPKPFTLYRSPKYPFLIGTPDAFITDRETGEQGILEIKTTNILKAMHREKWDNRIPDNYFIQVLHYMLMTGYSFAILKAQLKSTWNDGEVRLNTRHYRIERSEKQEDIDMIKEKCIYFWEENVKKDKRPDLILPPL